MINAGVLIVYFVSLAIAFFAGWHVALKAKRIELDSEKERNSFFDSIFETIKDFIEDNTGNKKDKEEVAKIVTEDGRAKEARHFF